VQVSNPRHVFYGKDKDNKASLPTGFHYYFDFPYSFYLLPAAGFVSFWFRDWSPSAQVW